MRTRPSFLIIGAQKSGTTALHAYLAEHPAVLLATKKEMHYFNDAYGPEPGARRAHRWYLSHFPLRSQAISVRLHAGVAPAVGETTPAYLFHPRVPERVHSFDPAMKLVAVLRDPVDRAFSQYQRAIRSGYHSLTFEEALDQEPEYLAAEFDRIEEDPLYVSPTGLRHSYVARGRYAEQLKRWLQFFPREQLLVFIGEELLSDPAREVARVERFLGIPQQRRSYEITGVNTYEDMHLSTRERLAREFEGQNRWLEEFLGRDLPWTRPTASTAASSGSARTGSP